MTSIRLGDLMLEQIRVYLLYCLIYASLSTGLTGTRHSKHVGSPISARYCRLFEIIMHSRAGVRGACPIQDVHAFMST